MAADDELDDILNSALEEFREDALSPSKQNETVAQTIKKAAQAAEAEQKATAKEKHVQETSQGLADILKNLDSPEFSENLEESLKFLSQGNKNDPQNPFNGGAVGPEIGEMDADIAANLQALSGVAGENMPGLGLEAANMEEAGSDMMQNMMKEFEKLAEKKDFDSVMNSMMQQLLSKEIMYEPIKEITEKYPDWLAENERKLDPEEYKKYGTQYQYMQKIVAVFESEPDNFERLTTLLTEMQAYGQPPSDIIKELAPGLQFSPDGMPLMPNMGSGFPAMNMPGMEGQNPANCSVM
mmetsp:Transcript_6595/g.9627  ORF Transcript_6595/g.9627 Transcript_6595/m.9627 type:complete len:296 (-) Transcript_6595:283-1170(-)|eukprot:CAMPEP_0195528656 /NCGR_PEP_ID=MMETSP0794_2-20130614/30896_1 /TAXON_ID=515487 /ORGANISM="Stephanopyxis turris, Strain CCMP 815" /LENGTH=295 /DNA_ID=CAMNT_0040659827 /DNA_START=100 /DNA_END=987 /DNA_ORIENTATION=+